MDTKYVQKPLPAKSILKTLQAKQETFFFQEALRLYIPQVGRFLDDDASQSASEAIRSWLHNPDKQCLLLLGDSGAGKTLFGQWLTRQTWSQARFQARIPLFIPLLAQSHPDKDLIDQYLKKTCGIEDESHREWIKQQPLLLILDGFDEIHQKINLYRSNKLWQLRDVKIIISCRSQALEHIYNYNTLFYPCDSQDKPKPDQLQKYVFNPFTENEVVMYLQKYVDTYQAEIKVSHPDWLQWQTYEAYIQKFPGLQALLISPFVLSIVVQVLPKIIAQYQGKENIEQLRLARINLYDHFVEQWFNRQKIKLLTAGHITDNCPIEELFIKCSKSIANAMLQAKVNRIELTFESVIPLLTKQVFWGEAEPKPQIDYKDSTLKYLDEEILFSGEKIKLSLILSGCPVMKMHDNQYAFLHKSLLEYFAARELFEGVMAGASIALGYELNDRLLVDEPETLQFLAERVEQDDNFKECLFKVLKESKFDERIEIAAANAITVLNYAGVSFSQKELKRIRIKGADLSNAILDSVDLRDADLREVSLRGTWLNNAKLGGSLMEKVKFGELPYLETERPITCIAYSPDERFLATGSKLENIQLWGFIENKWVVLQSYSVKGIISLAFSPDSSYLAAGSENNSIFFWGIKEPKILGVLNGHTGLVTSVAFSPDGNLLASGSEDYSVRFWDIKNQKCLMVLNEHTGTVTSLAFNPNGSCIVSGSGDKSVRLWDVKNQKCLSVFEGHELSVNSVAFSPDGSCIASGSMDETVRLWDVKSQISLDELNENTGPVESIVFNSDGSCTVSISYPLNANVRPWNVENKTSFGVVLYGHTGSIISVVFSPDGSHLASGSWDKSVRLWDIKSQKCVRILEGHAEPIMSVVFSPDGNYLASSSLDKSVRFWDTKNQTSLSVLNGHTRNVNSVVFSPDGSYLASGSSDKSVCFWDAKNQKPLGILDGHTKSVMSVAFSPDGRCIASGSMDGSVRLWDVKNQTPLGVLYCHKSDVKSLAFSPDGNCIVSGGMDGFVHFWDIKNQKCLRILNWYDSVYSVAFSPDGSCIASGGMDGSVRLWSVKNQKYLKVFEKQHTESVNSVAFSPDGSHLASGSSDKSVRIWDIKNQKCLKVFDGYTESVMSVAFSPDGSWLASVSDNSVCFLDMQTENHLNSLKLKSIISAPAFKKEGEKIYLCIGSDYAIYTFEIRRVESKLDFILFGSIGYDAGLMSEQLDLGGVVGLDQQYERLLKQGKAVGTLSMKETDKVLEDRSRRVPYNKHEKPIYNLFSSEYFITPENAVVSMVRKKDGQQGSEHVFLVIETVENNYYFIHRADFFLDQRQKHSKGLIFLSGQAHIEVCEKPLLDMQILAIQCEYECWRISTDRAHALLINLKADQSKPEPIPYFNMGNSRIYSANELGVENHNCLSWCEHHLAQINIDVSKQKSPLDHLVVIPQCHIPNNQKNNSSVNFSFWTKAGLATVAVGVVGIGLYKWSREEDDSNTKCLIM